MKQCMLISGLLLTLFLAGCEEDDRPLPDLQSSCDAFAIVSENGYDQLNGNTFQITEASITEDCLQIALNAGGVCEHVKIHLYDSGSVAESFPEQRFLRLIFNNDGVCNDFVEKVISFDIRDLRLQNGSNEVLLNLEGWDSLLSYQY